MAKQTKPAAKPQTSKNTHNLKPKGPKPDFTPKVKKLRPAQEIALRENQIKAQVVAYYGEDTPIGVIAFQKADRKYNEELSRQICWAAAKNFLLSFQPAGREIIFKLASMATQPIETGGAKSSYELNGMEHKILGYAPTAGKFSKRIRFWNFVTLLSKDEHPVNFVADPDIEFGFLPSATTLQELTKDIGEKAKKLRIEIEAYDFDCLVYISPSTTGSYFDDCLFADVKIEKFSEFQPTPDIKVKMKSKLSNLI